MVDSRDKLGCVLGDADGLTPFCIGLRSTSLDELPHLFNVLRGNTSLVGPRPLPPEYTPSYNMKQARRLDVIPGIIGWSQVNGRNEVSWDRKLSMDVWYAENRSFLLDILILMKTVRRVICRDSISFMGHVSMPAFTEQIGKDSK